MILPLAPPVRVIWEEAGLKVQPGSKKKEGTNPPFFSFTGAVSCLSKNTHRNGEDEWYKPTADDDKGDLGRGGP